MQHTTTKYWKDPSLRVRIVPMLDDNYGNDATVIDTPSRATSNDSRGRHVLQTGYIVVDEANHTMFAVDPAEPSKILPVLREEEKAQNRRFLGILTTHKHAYVRIR